jgi:hypothetical protein
MKTAVTDLHDNGPYVAKIIADDRTVKKVCPLLRRATIPGRYLREDGRGFGEED